MTEAPHLLPCPFCGGDRTYTDGSADCTGTPHAGCFDCGAHITSDTIPEAIAAWNRRAAPEVQAMIREAVADHARQIADLKALVRVNLMRHLGKTHEEIDTLIDAAIRAWEG